MAKLPGITSGVITLGGVSLSVTGGTITLKQEEIEYSPIVADGETAYSEYIPGGKISAEGSVDFAFDSSTGTSVLEMITAKALKAVVFNIGSAAVSFDALISEVEVKKENSGLCAGSAKYKSSGEITIG